MAIFSVDMKLSQLGKKLEDFSEFALDQVNEAIKSISRMAYNQGIANAQKLNNTRQQYINSFHYKEMGEGVYLIYLDDEANFIEAGFPSFDMKPGLLNGPKSKPTADGKGRYNTVPFTHKPQSKAPMSLTEQLINTELRGVIRRHNLSKTFKDKAGKPLSGVVAKVVGKNLSENLQGVVKIQKQYKGATQSVYMTFRRVSSNSAPNSWIHPGYKGLHNFRDLEQWVDRKVNEVLKAILE